MLEIIAVTFDQDHCLKCFVESFLAQVHPDWKMHLIHDGPSEKFDEICSQWNDPRIKTYKTKQRFNDFGHSLREIGVSYLTNSQFTLFTNADNYYVPTFTKVLANYHADFVYFDMIHSYSEYELFVTATKLGRIDCGSFVTNTRLVKNLGWHSKRAEADWDFVHEVLKYAKTVVKIKKVFFVHN